MPVQPMVKTCADCGSEFEAKFPKRQVRCAHCQRERKLEQDRARQRGGYDPIYKTLNIITEYPTGDYMPADSPVWGNLAEAIIHDAISTKRQYGKSAGSEVRWLMGKQCRLLCDCIGFDHNIIMDWIKQGCPSAEGENRGRYKRKREAAHA